MNTERSMDGVREMLFETLDLMRDGTLETRDAVGRAHVAMAIIKSVDVQLKFEKQRLADEVPGRLPSMPLKALTKVGNAA